MCNALLLIETWRLMRVITNNENSLWTKHQIIIMNEKTIYFEIITCSSISLYVRVSPLIPSSMAIESPCCRNFWARKLEIWPSGMATSGHWLVKMLEEEMRLRWKVELEITVEFWSNFECLMNWITLASFMLDQFVVIPVLHSYIGNRFKSGQSLFSICSSCQKKRRCWVNNLIIETRIISKLRLWWSNKSWPFLLINYADKSVQLYTSGKETL